MRNKLAQKIKLGAALLLMAGTSAFAQTSNQIYTPTPENIKARQEFQDNKFGIFLHWGIYSMTAQGEWYMNTHNINRNEYAKLASGFYPSRFDAAEWVSAIKTSGAKYICITRITTDRIIPPQIMIKSRTLQNHSFTFALRFSG